MRTSPRCCSAKHEFCVFRLFQQPRCPHFPPPCLFRPAFVCPHVCVVKITAGASASIRHGLIVIPRATFAVKLGCDITVRSVYAWRRGLKVAVTVMPDVVRQVVGSTSEVPVSGRGQKRIRVYVALAGDEGGFINV